MSGSNRYWIKRPYRHLYIRNRDERPYRLERAGSFLAYELPCGSSVPEILATSHDRRGYGETGIRTDIGHGEYLSVTPDYPSYQRDKEKEITQAFLEQKISTELPASLLWLHPNVICLIDRKRRIVLIKLLQLS